MDGDGPAAWRREGRGEPRDDGPLAPHSFAWHRGRLQAEDVDLERLAAEVGTPAYVYSARAIRTAYRRFAAAFAPLRPRIHYAVKANSNLALLRLLRAEGAGMDVVSGGELERAWLAGTPLDEIAFAGVGKTDAEIRAALDGRASLLGAEARRLGASLGLDPARRGAVGMFNVESESELERIAAIAAEGTECGVRARVCLRVNPDVDAHAHEYTSTGRHGHKFGIEAERIVELVAEITAGGGRGKANDRFAALDFAGLHVHLGSPVARIEPYLAAIDVLERLIAAIERRGGAVAILDLGGGWPAPYQEAADPEVSAQGAVEPLAAGAAGNPGFEPAPPLEEYAAEIAARLAPRIDRGLGIVLEPGRSLVANAGVLLTRIQHLKRTRTKTFAIADAGMQTLIRPALYRAFHFVWPARWDGPPPRAAESTGLAGLERVDLVGPICESSDFLAKDRELPPLRRGEVVAVFSAGAYGASMASHYNDHVRPVEVLVDGHEARVVAPRPPLAALFTDQVAAGIDPAAATERALSRTATAPRAGEGTARRGEA